METYSHVVVKKMRRAGIVGLFAAGLAFTGVTPANALSGKGFQTSDLGQNGGAVATISVPKGGDTLEYNTCTGVLIGSDEVLTSSDCFPYANSPYKDVFTRKPNTRMTALAKDTARIMFAGSGGDNIYFSVSAVQPTNTKWGLTVVKLDRPVTGATPVSKVENLAKDGESVNLVGWATSDFTNTAGAVSRNMSSRDLLIAHRVGPKTFETSPLSWESFNNMGSAIPEIDITPGTSKTDIVPGFTIPGLRTSKDNLREVGSPVITGDGKLQGILVGYNGKNEPVFIDAGEKSIADWIYHERPSENPGLKVKATNDKDLADQYTDLRNMLCSNIYPTEEEAEAQSAKLEKEKAEEELTIAQNRLAKHTPEYTAASEQWKNEEEAFKKAQEERDAAKTYYDTAERDWKEQQEQYKKINNPTADETKAYKENEKKFETAAATWNADQNKFSEAERKYNSAEEVFNSQKEKYDKYQDDVTKAEAAFDKANKKYEEANEKVKPGSPLTKIFRTYQSKAEEDSSLAETNIGNYNEEVKDKSAQFGYSPLKPVVPNYEKPLADPGYIVSIPTDADKWQAYCRSQEGSDLLDMNMMYKEALKIQDDYNSEKDKQQQKVNDALAVKNDTTLKFEAVKREAAAAQAACDFDPTDEQKCSLAASKNKEREAAEMAMNTANKSYEQALDLQDQVSKSLSQVVEHSVKSILGNLQAIAATVDNAQKNWTNEDQEFLSKYQTDLKNYLDNQSNKYKNSVTEGENADHCKRIDPATGKTLCDDGYPKPLLPVQNLEDPTPKYLNSDVPRDYEAYYDDLNKAVPLMLESRFQLWNMKRMTDMLKKGGNFDADDKRAMQQEIIDIIDKANAMKQRLSDLNGDMQKSWTDLEKIYAQLPQAVKDTLDKKGYKDALVGHLSAQTAYNGTHTDYKQLSDIKKELYKTSTARELNVLLDKATSAYANTKDTMNILSSTTDLIKQLTNYAQAVVDGNVPKDKDPDPTWGMTEPQKKAYEEALAKQKAAEEKAAALEKAEADKKKAAEEAKKKAEQEKKDKDKKDKSEKDKKKDEQDKERLARALSKNTLRADGSDRVLTAIAAWKMGNFPGDSVVLVDGNVHADGLSATPLAAALHAPVLLTTWKTGLEPALLDQLKVSGKKNVYLVGGQVPMNPYDEFELNEAGMTVHRIAGPDRFGTAVAVNQMTEPLVGAAPKKPLNLYIADGVGFPDALVAGAAAGRTGSLMLLSKGNTLDPNTFGYISALGQTRPLTITAVGGPAVHAVQNTPWPTTMSVNIKPVMGKDRYETAALTAGTQAGTTAAVLVTGQNFPDALSGGALAVDQNAALVLTKTEELPPSSYQALQRYGANKTIVVGGPGAVSAKVAELVNGAALENPDSVNVTGTLKEREEVKAAAAAKLAELQERKLEAIKKGDWDTLAEIEKENQKAQSALRRYSTPSRAAAGTRTPASAGTNNSLDYVQSLLRSGNSMQDVFNKMGVSSISQLAHLINTGSPTAASMPYPNPTFS